MEESSALVVKPSVLIVDDDEQQAAAAGQALIDRGYRVRYARYSLDGLKAIEDEPPAIVVLDWEMPFIDGETFLRALKAGMADPPAVVVVVGPTTDVAEVRRAGASACVHGLQEPSELLDIVRELLGDSQVASLS